MFVAVAFVLSPLAHADPTEAAWVYGVAERGAQEENELSVWLVDDNGVDATRARSRPRPPASSPTPPPPPPSGNTTGAGVLVAVVDTGIDLDHPEFAGRIASGGTCFGAAAACPGLAASGDDNHGHGTHVAGIVAAAANGIGNTGVASGASLLPVKVLDAGGSGAYSSVASGVSYAASKGARVINLSLGGSSPSTLLVAPLQQAAATSVIVAAAGNSGTSFAPGYPAAYATQAGIVGSMIIAGSVNAQNVISSFSQTPGSGGCVASGGKTTCFKDVFLVAPGQSIYSTYVGGGYATMSGTSMATPYISGVAARVLGASPFLTAKQVVSILLQSATDLGVKGIDPIYGRGLVNLQVALAPIGAQSIATSGGTTASFTGTRSVAASGISGVFAAGLRRSQIAKAVVFFDAFGRDYTTDLTDLTTGGPLNLANVVGHGAATTRFVAAAGAGFEASAIIIQDSPTVVIHSGLTERSTILLSDVLITAHFDDWVSVTVGQNASLGHHMNQLDLGLSNVHDASFISALAFISPFLSLTENATFVAASLKVGQGVTLDLARAESEQDTMHAFDDEVLTVEEHLMSLAEDPSRPRAAQNTVASISWPLASWGALGLTVAQTEEQNSTLGTLEGGALALTNEASTISVGLGAQVDLGDDWLLSASWSHGTTEITSVSGGLMHDFSGVESEAYGLAVSRIGVLGKSDSIGIAISRPLHITNGFGTLTASTGVTEAREIIYSSEGVDLASATPETDFEVGYTAALAQGLALQANAVYQQNVAGEAGQDAVAAYVTLTSQW